MAATVKQRSAKEDLYVYVDDPHYCYVEFSRSSSSEGGGARGGARGGGAGGARENGVGGGKQQRVQTFLTQDFSWEDQGFALACRLYMEIGELLDDKFKLAQQLTYNT